MPQNPTDKTPQKTMQAALLDSTRDGTWRRPSQRAGDNLTCHGRHRVASAWKPKLFLKEPPWKGVEQRNGRNAGSLDDCAGQSTPLSPLSWASFAPGVKRFKRKHILSPYGKGRGLERSRSWLRGSQAGSRRCRLVLPSLICSRNGQGGANLLHV